jgi:trimethylguanosine synthase
MKLDCVYLSPPWGGPEYYEKPSLSPDELSPPLSKIIEKSLGMSDNLAMLLPINIDVGAVAEYLFEKSKLQAPR